MWHEVAGIGAILEESVTNSGGTTKKVQYCCTQDAIEQSLCDAADVGKLILKKKEGVFHRSIDILGTGEVDELVSDSRSYRTPGEHVVIMAHCNPNGRPVHVLGNWNFHVHGSDAPTASPNALPSPPATAPTGAPPSSGSWGYLDSDTDGRSWKSPLAWGFLAAAILIVCFVVAVNRYMYDQMLSSKNIERVASRQNMLVDFSDSSDEVSNGIDDILDAFDDDSVGLDLELAEEETVKKPLPSVT